jgi:hypothetical protein
MSKVFDDAFGMPQYLGTMNAAEYETRDRGSNRSMIFIHWRECVMSAAKASHEETEPFADKLQLWFRSGEEIWSAAPTLRAFIDGKKKADRADRSSASLRNLVKQAIKGGV